MDSLVEPGTTDPENLCPGFLVIPTMDSRLVSGFRLVKRIGSGGSGVVYQAQLPSEVHGQPDVALKLLRRGDRLDVSQRVRDVQILKGLDHPDLVRVYAAGESLGLGPFVATEFVEGSNLGDWLDANGPLDERDAAEVVRTLALALNAAHGRGIVHCDVTPRNVFGCLQSLNPSRLKIGDFGLSRFVPSDVGTATGSRDTGGTVGYMAPEQYWGKPSHRSDLYALGAMLIRLTAPRKADFLSDEQARTLHSLCGWSAFALDAGERRRQVYEAFRDLGLMEPADVVRDPQLRTVLAKCLAFEQGDRYETADQLAGDLTAWLERRPVQHARYEYRPLERLRMLTDRCRERENFEDHSQLWGLACLAVGTSAVVTSSLCTVLVLLGATPPGRGHGRRWSMSLLAG